MRVLIGTHFFESHRGGIEIVAGQLARHFVSAGLGVTWVAADATPAPRPEDGCGTAVPLRASNVVEMRLGLPFPLPGPGALRKIWREVGHADAVMLHDSLYPTNLALRAAAWFARKPVVIVQHIGAVPYRSRVLRTLMRLANHVIARRMLASADQVVFISETTSAYFAGVRFRNPPALILNGVDTALFRPVENSARKPALRDSLGLPEFGPTILFVGRFVEKKGLRVLEHLARAMPEVCFVFAGWGPVDPQRWTLPNVRVLEARAGPTLVPLYQASDLFVLPSTGEGLPLVVQEALASGLPVLCGTDSATADAGLAGWVTGIPVDPADDAVTAAAFEAAIRRHLAQPEDPAWIEACSAACRSRYDWSAAAAAHRAILDRLCGRPIGMGPSETLSLSHGP